MAVEREETRTCQVLRLLDIHVTTRVYHYDLCQRVLLSSCEKGISRSHFVKHHFFVISMPLGDLYVFGNPGSTSKVGEMLGEQPGQQPKRWFWGASIRGTQNVKKHGIQTGEWTLWGVLLLNDRNPERDLET